MGLGEPSAVAPWPERNGRHLLVNSAQMAALEEQLFASGLPVEALMEKAALAVSRLLLEQHGERLARHGALVLVGPGHNGGDGLVIARELHLAGISTAIWSPFEHHKPLSAAHLRHALWLGIPRLEASPDPGSAALWIDALLGSGQRRAPGEAIEALLRQRQRQRPGALVAIDVPTGLCADSGQATGSYTAQAISTYAIGLLKTGLVQDAALEAVGALHWVDLGLPPSLLQELPVSAPLALAERDLAARPKPKFNPAASKYQRGRLLVVAGSDTYRGAASLALAGASSSGCGSLRAALPEALASSIWQQHPQVVLSLDPPAELDPQRLDALLVGPGLGEANCWPNPPSWNELLSWQGLLVLDADGLNRLAGPVSQGLGLQASQWLQQRQGPTWITPHPGEFAHLFPELAGSPALEAAGQAASSSGACVLLKGARSIVAAPDGRRWQLLEASPGSARTGLGDVLAGYAAGIGAMALAASGNADAAWLAAAALAHAQAGRRGGKAERGFTPMQVAENLAQLC